MGGGATHFFLDALLGPPPGPPQTKVLWPKRRTAQRLILGRSLRPTLMIGV
jgi:hypothetical protein